MQKSYQEIIPQRKDWNKVVPEHIAIYEYDTNNIKDFCVSCSKEIGINEERYIKRGNFCEKCNVRYI